MTSLAANAPVADSPTRSVMMWVLRLVVAVVVICVLCGLQVMLERTINQYILQQIITLSGVAVILAVSLNLINGITGQFSLGHAGFMAVGAYASAAFTVYAGPKLNLLDPVLFLFALIVAALAAGVAGLLVGLPALRLRGDYLAIVTLGFGQIIIVLIRNTPALGEATGFINIPRFTSFAWTWGMAILCILSVRNLANSSVGRSMRAVREDEIAAAAVGVDTARIKVLAFVVSSMWAGVAGALQAHLLMIAHPDNFTFQESVKVVVMVVLGGLGSISGSVVAAVLLRILEEKLRGIGWAFGVSIVLCVVTAALSFPRYRPAIKKSALGWFRWIMWPALGLVGIVILYLLEHGWLQNHVALLANVPSGWLQSNVASLRYVIYALILIVLMLLRPQGLFGRGEIGMHLLQRKQRK